MPRIPPDPVLTNIAKEYKNPGFIAPEVFPVVDVGAKSFKYFEFPEVRRETPETRHAPGAAFARITYEVEEKPGVCVEHGLEIPLTDEDQREAERRGIVLLDLARRDVEVITDILLLGWERRVASLLRDPAKITQNKTLSGTSQWNDFVNSDPLGDIELAKSTVATATGYQPNVIVLPRVVWGYLRRHPKIVGEKAAISVEEAKDVLEIENILVAYSAYNAAAPGAAPQIIPVWGKDVVVCYVEGRAANPRLPSVGYSFREFGPEVATYRADEVAADITRVQLSQAEILVAEKLAYLIVNAVA